MAPSSTETRVGFESWCKDRYYFLKTKKRPNIFHLRLSFQERQAGISENFPARIPEILDFGYFVKTVKIMKTSSLMMCALVALTACGTGVKQSVRTPVEMGERIELKTPDPKMGLTINEALAARSSSRDFSPEMLSLEELSGVLWAAAGVNREDGHLTAPSAMALYPIRVYAFLPEGVYRYDSKANVLNRVIEGDRRELTAMQDSLTLRRSIWCMWPITAFMRTGISRWTASVSGARPMRADIRRT